MKNLLKKLFVPTLASRPISAMANAVLGHGVPIFMLHRMEVEGQPSTGITPDHLRRCLRYLSEHGYTFVSLEDVIVSLNTQTPLPDKAVAFTMDDGFSDQAQVAAPVFLEFDCPLTFFVITGLLNRTLWPWDAQVAWIIDNAGKNQISIQLEDELLQIKLGNKHERHRSRQEVRNVIKEIDAAHIPEILGKLAEAADVQIPQTAPSAYQPLDWDTARELENKGIRFAPHSITHRILSKLNRQTAEEEIKGSWQTLSRELRNPLKVFCYPTGRILDFGPREIDILSNEGFLGAVSTIPGYAEPGNHSVSQLFSLPRFELPDNMPDFIQYCSWIEHAKTRRYVG